MPDKIAPNTFVWTVEVKKVTNVKYYDTVIVKFTTEDVVLNSGGFNTKSTAQRMNMASEMYGLGYEAHWSNGSIRITCGGRKYTLGKEELHLRR